METTQKTITAIDEIIDYISPYQNYDLQQDVELEPLDSEFTAPNGGQPILAVNYGEFKNLYKKRTPVKDENGTLTLYVHYDADANYWKYYRKRTSNEAGEPVEEYHRFGAVSGIYTWVELSPAIKDALVLINLTDADLPLSYPQTFFHMPSGKLYVKIENTIAINNWIVYNPTDFEGLPIVSQHQLNFTDERGLGNNVFHKYQKFILDVNLHVSSDRKLSFARKDKAGYVSHYPIIEIPKLGDKFKLHYEYVQSRDQRKRNTDATAKQSVNFQFLDQPFGERAFGFEFETVFGFLAFIKQTFYPEDYFSHTPENGRTEINAFREKYIQVVGHIFSDFRFSSTDQYKVLYFIPNGMVSYMPQRDLWMFLHKIVGENVTNIGIDKEDLVLEVLNGLKTSMPAEAFLSSLMDFSTNGERLMDRLMWKMDGGNFEKMMLLIWGVWSSSVYAKFDPKENPAFSIRGDSPVLIEYASDKKLTFHVDNATIAWTAGQEKIAVQMDNKKWTFATVLEGVKKLDSQEKYLASRQQKPTELALGRYEYHPYAPLAIWTEKNTKFLFQTGGASGQPFIVLPAIVLLAREKKAFWENFQTGSEYLLDILSTFSGVGNILKAGRLFRILQTGNKALIQLNKASKLKAGVLQVSGVIELTAGVGNTLLKLTDSRDTELGRALSHVFMILELGALAGEMSVALRAALRKVTQQTLDNPTLVKLNKDAQDYIRKNTDGNGVLTGGKQVDEALNTLETYTFLQRTLDALIEISDAVLDGLIKAGAIVRVTVTHSAKLTRALLADLKALNVQLYRIVDQKILRRILDKNAPSFAFADTTEFFAIRNGDEIFSGTKKQFDEFADDLNKARNKGEERRLRRLEKRLAEAKYYNDYGIHFDGQTLSWTNPKGRQLWWSRLKPKANLDKIAAKLQKIKDGKTKQSGEIYEVEVAHEIAKIATKNGDEITDFANKVNHMGTKKLNGEIDFATQQYIFEIKSSLSNSKDIANLEDQLEKYIVSNRETVLEYMNPFDKKVVVVYDKMGAGNVTAKIIANLESQGVIFINGIENLNTLY